MLLGELKKHIEDFEEGHLFDFTLSEPFSWRGDYSEVAFSIKKEQSTKESLLELINTALTGEYYGYKGGLYKFDENTFVNFEDSPRSWSDGGYVLSKLEELDCEHLDPEEKLIKLAFR